MSTEAKKVHETEFYKVVQLGTAAYELTCYQRPGPELKVQITQEDLNQLHALIESWNA